MNIAKLPFTFDVRPLQEELKAHPELWNDFRFRTESPISPHRELDDIIVRYNPRENFDGNRAKFNEPHESEWYDGAKLLPSLRPLVFDLMRAVEGERLGMVLITRIPSGKQCYPHVDGGWHASYYEKFAIQVAGNPEQRFAFDGEELRTVTGDSFWFDNSHTHWVENPSGEDRITLICSIRRSTCLPDG